MLAMNAEVGTNFPPIADSAAELLAGLPERLAAETHALQVRRDALIMASARVPAVTDDEISGKVADFLKQLTEHLKTVDEWKDGAKAPVLKLDRAIMARHMDLSESVKRTKQTITAMQTDYLRDKAAKELADRQEAERVAREAAEKARLEAEAAAASITTDADLTAAVQAEEAAVEAQKAVEVANAAANVKPAELARVTGNYGSTNSLRTKWVFKPETVNVDKIDLEALRPYLAADDLHKAIRKFIASGRHELKGVVIEQEYTAR